MHSGLLSARKDVLWLLESEKLRVLQLVDGDE